jgi:hypothetical protein
MPSRQSHNVVVQTGIFCLPDRDVVVRQCRAVVEVAAAVLVVWVLRGTSISNRNVDM